MGGLKKRVGIGLALVGSVLGVYLFWLQETDNEPVATAKEVYQNELSIHYEEVINPENRPAKSPEQSKDKPAISARWAEENDRAANYPNTLDVTFPTGDVLPVTYKLSARYRLRRRNLSESGNYLINIIGLADQGNGAAAHRAFELLSECEIGPRTQAEYQDAAELLKTKGIFRFALGPNGIDTYELGSMHHKSAAKELKHRLALCGNVSVGLVANKSAYEELAIELDDYSALLNLALSEDPDENPKRPEILQKIWNLGYVRVADLIAHSYENRATALTYTAPDYLTSYAYLLARYMVASNAYRNNDPPNNAPMNPRSDPALGPTVTYLSPEQRLQAERLAVDLIRKNINCCIGPWAFY